MDSSIGDILNNNEPAPEAAVEAPPEAETPVEAVETPPETVERPRGPDGKFIPKGEAEAPAPVESAPPAPTEESHIPIAALKDERSKRQIAEDRARQLEEQLRQLQQPQAQPQAVPDRWEDPEGYDQWLIAQTTETARQAAIEAVQIQRIQQSVASFAADKPDYQEVITLYQQMALQNPGLDQQMKAAENPAKFAYDTAKLQLEIQQYGSLEGLIEARVAARQAEALQSLPAQLPQSTPPTISSDRSVGARSGPAWSGPAPISDYLK